MVDVRSSSLRTACCLGCVGLSCLACLPRQSILGTPPAPPPDAPTRPAYDVSGSNQNPSDAPSPVVPAIPVGSGSVNPAQKVVTAKNAGPGEIPEGAEIFETVTTGYSTENTAMEGGPLDMKGARLNTFKDYLLGKKPYVSVAMDNASRAGGKGSFPYGTTFRFPEVEKRYGKVILFRMVDTGSAFKGKGKTRMDVCLGTSQRDIGAYPFLSGHNRHKVWVVRE